MVVDEQVGLVFHALSDATRRDIVTVVMAREQSVSQLADRYPMSFAAVQKHVAVLERAGLVEKERRGREQRVRGRVEAIREARRLLDELEALWTGRLDRIGHLLSETDPGAPPGPGPTTQT